MWLFSLLEKGKIDPNEIGYNPGITNGGDGLDKILSLVYFWAAIIAVITIVAAGFLFTTARGDATQMQRAKLAVRGAVIGLIIVFLAFVITRFVLGGVKG